MLASKLIPGLPAIALAALPSLASAYNWQSNYQWGTWSNNGYTVAVDAWGQAGATVGAWSGTQFDTWANYGGGGVKAYPHNQKNKGQSVDSYSWANASINVGGGNGAYDWAFDNWQPQETMIWNKWQNVGPIGSQKYWNASIGGWTFNVYNGGSNVTSLLATGQFTYSTGVPIGACMEWVKNKYGGNWLTSVQYGVEISNGNATWNCWNASYP